MLFDIAMLAVGLVLLFIAGDYLVKGAVGMAERLGVPALIIGLTIVAFGTSAPELVVALKSVLAGAPDIATGNVVGSNVANVLLVMGLPALFAPICASQRGLSRNVSIMLVFTAIFMWQVHDGFLDRTEAATLFAGLLAFIAFQVFRARSQTATARAEDLAENPAEDLAEDLPADYHDDIGEAPHSPVWIAVYLIGALIGLPIAAHFTVQGATGIAEAFGVSEAVIGLTIVAVGTSLPELATSLAAALRRQTDVALGNVIGSNIFNIAAIMGITGMVVPIRVSPFIVDRDIWMMLAASLVLAIICYGRLTIGRWLGAAMLVAYVLYIVLLF